MMLFVRMHTPTVALMFAACTPAPLAEVLEYLDPGDIACVRDEQDAIVDAVVDEFGGWSPEGGRAVWCDLPGVQAEASGREVFVPLDAVEIMAWEACTYSGSYDVATGVYSGEYVCARTSIEVVRPSVQPWAWACKNGREVTLGSVVDWTCGPAGMAGDSDSYITGTWSVGLNF